MKISCVIPVFNGEKFLRETLESIGNQTLAPLEIVVADDGSSDASLDIARGFPLVRIVTQKTAGPAATRNLGWRSARGDFVAFLDADDLWHPEKLAIQSEILRENPEIAFCVSLAQMFWTNPQEAENFAGHERAKPIPGYATTTLLARRELFQTIGAFNESLWFTDATEWFMRAEEAGVRSHLVEKVLTFHRMHGANLTRRRSDESRAEFLQVVRASLRRRRARA